MARVVPLTREVEVPETLFIDHVSPPLVLDWPTILGNAAGGTTMVPLGTGGEAILNVRNYRKVSFMIGSTAADSVRLCMGKLSGTTCGAGDFIPVDRKIHSFAIEGPEIWLELHGKRGIPKENAQLWLYLSS